MSNLVEQTKTTLNRLLDTIEKLREENKNLKQNLEDIKEGFEGCCYACEPVGTLNQDLETKNNEWKDVARKLYSVALHLEAIARDKPVAVIGDGLYSESVDAIKAYEELYGK